MAKTQLTVEVCVVARQIRDDDIGALQEFDDLRRYSAWFR